MTHQQNEPAREDIAKRLARVAGHANSLKRLWEEGRECDDMLTQIAAVRAALDQVSSLVRTSVTGFSAGMTPASLPVPVSISLSGT